MRSCISRIHLLILKAKTRKKKWIYLTVFDTETSVYQMTYYREDEKRRHRLEKTLVIHRTNES